MKQDIGHIKELLDAYYQAATTREQEEELADFFSGSSDVPPELMADRELFLSLSDAEIPAGLESTLSDMIDCR